MTPQRTTNFIFYGLIIYFIILFILAPTNLLSFDTYYYWDWSRHLALSYYDGSPMIAYLIKLSTLLFGDTLFALSFIGILSTAITSWIIYMTGRLFLSKEGSYIAVALWVFSPFVTLDILKQTTYDTPLTVFWALTLYCSTKFIKTHENKWIYRVGLSIGLMMLSKYSGVILILALFIFLLINYRYLFKTPHLYLAMLLAVVLFSPVILWNYQHHWDSFLYQLNTHKLETRIHPVWGMFKFFFTTFLPVLNFMLIPPLLCWLKMPSYFSMRAKRNTSNTTLIVNLCRIACTTLACFYLLTASQAVVKNCWLVPYLLTSALLGGFCFQTFHYRKLTFGLIIAYAITSVGILVNNSPQFALTTPTKLINYYLIQNFNATHHELPKIVLSPGWMEARSLFFLKNKPYIYTVDCGRPQNQYIEWSTVINKKIKNKTLKEVLFIDMDNHIACVQKYFKQCAQLHSPTYTYKKREYTFYAYRCTN